MKAAIIPMASANHRVESTAMSVVRHRSITVEGIRIFYREAGDPQKPTILLLHGFPTSSQMYRDLMPLLAPHFHLIAPDYPGAGHSDAPGAETFEPTFANLARLMARFIGQLELHDITLYVQDFGGPVGFRIAVDHPEWIRGLIIQNANAYVEGIAPEVLDGMRARSGEFTAAKYADASTLVNRETAMFFYQTGVRDASTLNPDAWSLDAAVLENAEARRIQTHLIVDYYDNITQYLRWQAYFRARQPQTLIVWGQNDPVFLPSGANAYLRDLPEAERYFFDTGHFALEEDRVDIAQHIIRCFSSIDR